MMMQNDIQRRIDTSEIVPLAEESDNIANREFVATADMTANDGQVLMRAFIGLRKTPTFKIFGYLIFDPRK